MTTNDYEIIHNLDRNRFEVTIEGLTAELVYRKAGDTINFRHTGVPEAIEGRGIGSALARTGLEYAKQEGLTVIPSCPFVRHYIDRHPEYQPLLTPSQHGTDHE
ncbi:MAG: N-acetyltransferase [Anaerolineae bacterium]|nr:N-acetyltransferase [Anaerolineae bacterium]